LKREKPFSSLRKIFRLLDDGFIKFGGIKLHIITLKRTQAKIFVRFLFMDCPMLGASNSRPKRSKQTFTFAGC
jgi:hypothetical protein